MSEKENNMEELNGCCPHCSGKHKDRDDKEKRDLMNRLKRIEGQVRGVEGELQQRGEHQRHDEAQQLGQHPPLGHIDFISVHGIHPFQTRYGLHCILVSRAMQGKIRRRMENAAGSAVWAGIKASGSCGR